MKPVKKILALILAGVMALALLTGCGKAASLNRTMAEGMGDYLNYLRSHYGNPDPVSVSYQVPELGRNIAPLFGANWMSSADSDNKPNENAVISGTTTVKEALQQCLSNYRDASCTVFYAADITDYANSALLETYQLLTESEPVVVSGDINKATLNATHLRIAATHKTIGEKTFLLAVVIYE